MSINDFGSYFITGGNQAIEQNEYSKIIKNPLNKIIASQRWTVNLHPSDVKMWSIRNETYRTYLRPDKNFYEVVTSKSPFYWRTNQASTMNPNLNVFVFFAIGPGDDALAAGDSGYYAYWGLSDGDNVRLVHSSTMDTINDIVIRSWNFEKGTFDYTLLGKLPDCNFLAM